MTDQAATAPPAKAFPRGVVVLVGFAAFIITMAGLQQVANIVAPTFLAITLVITINPLRRWMTNHRIPGWLATVVTLLVLYGLVIALIGAIAWAVAELVDILPTYSQQFTDMYTAAADAIAEVGVDREQIDTVLAQIDYGSVFGYVQGFVGQAASAGSLFIFMLTALVFLVMDAASVPARLAELGKVKPDLAAALQGFATRIRTYWSVTTLFGAIVAVLDGIALAIIGVPLALTWAVFSFITNYIPNIGFVLGLIPPALLALVDGGVGPMIAVIVVYAVLNVVIQTVIQPRVTGDAIGLSAIVAFLSLVFWTVVLGPLGSILALPSTLFIKTVLIDANPEAKWVNVFLSDRVEKEKPAEQTLTAKARS